MRWQLGMFDWDGTLFDSLGDENRGAYGAVVQIFKAKAPHLPPPSLEEYRNEITSNFTEFYYRHGISQTVSGGEMNGIRNAWLRAQPSAGLINEGAQELLAFCRAQGTKTAIVSANPESDKLFKKRLEDENLLSLIDLVRLRAWPKEEALRETLNFFGVEARRSFYLDDTYEGLITAKKLGIKAIGFAGGYNCFERIVAAKPFLWFSSLRGLTIFLKLTAGSKAKR